MTAYYNEFDPKAAAWLRELIADGLIAAGDVDERSIVDVQGSDLEGYRQCHFFAGIGGWSYALRLAGWSDDVSVWTGSCPCQPFSSAGFEKGTEDYRDLWPDFARLIRECGPSVVMGEQVPRAILWGWLDRAFDDLEAQAYSCAAAVLPSSAFGANHVRERLYWAASSNADGCRRKGQRATSEKPWSREQFERLLSAVLRTAVPSGRYGALSDGLPGRLGLLRGAGNAIVPQVAAEFVKAYMEVR